jgi:predicted phosphodiesterase
VATAALQANPDLVLHTGDLVARGADDWRWDEEFHAPAKDLLATVPFYGVLGNHDGNAPILGRLFPTPGIEGMGWNWSQRIGPAFFVGINGAEKWSKDSENARWLDKTLAEAKTPFTFLVTHYSAWSSARHGKLRLDGKPEGRILEAQKVILPLLIKHKVTAMIAGHDHCYERSEPPGEVSVIVTGGGGARLYKKEKEAGAKKQNPHSEAFASELHYCLFVVDGRTCTMQALTPDGRQLDTRTWEARTPAR